MCTGGIPGGRSGEQEWRGANEPEAPARAFSPHCLKFSMAAPLAYFLTWRTYGSWLHGDERSSVDAHHNIPGTPRVAPDRARECRASDAMSDEPFAMTSEMRAVVDAVVRRHCEFRSWTLMAVNVRTEHVHVVVDCRQLVSPEVAMEQFKAWATRRLREAGHARPDQKVWAEHGSTRWVDSVVSLAEAVEYVLNRQ